MSRWDRYERCPASLFKYPNSTTKPHADAENGGHKVTFTADTLVVNVAPRMSRDAFVAWLQSVKSPAVATGGAGYDAIVANKVDPLF